MRRPCLYLICMTFVLFTGCWDAIDIEERAYVLGVAIDEYPPIPHGLDQEANNSYDSEEEKLELNTEIDSGNPMYAMTIQLPIIKLGRMPAALGGGAGGGAETPRTWEITQVGNSFMEINRTIATRINQKPYYEHMSVIVISEKVARKGVKKVLDFFIRDPEMRSRTRVFVTKGDAKEVLDVIPRIEDYSSIYLSKTANNAKVTAKLIYWNDLGRAVQSMYSGRDFTLASVNVTNDEIQNIGAAVFKGDKMVGWIDGSEVESGKLLRNIYKGGIVTSRMPQNKDAIITLEVTKAKSKIIPSIQGNKVGFNAQITIAGNLAENVNSTTTIEVDREFVEEAAMAFENTIKEQCLKTINRLQKDLESDIIHFSSILKTKKPAYWKQIKDDWYDIYQDAKMDIDVEVTIKQVGNIR